MKPRRNKTIGDWGESQACNFLVRQGFKIIERNYHSTQGEIDIIAHKQDDYYFIEVKTRLQKEFGSDLAITPFKKIKFQKTIKSYCYKRNIVEGSFIFAGIIVLVDKPKKTVTCRLAVFY